MGTERGGCSRLMKTPRHNDGAVHGRSKNKEKGTCCSRCLTNRRKKNGSKSLQHKQKIQCNLCRPAIVLSTVV